MAQTDGHSDADKEVRNQEQETMKPENAAAEEAHPDSLTKSFLKNGDEDEWHSVSSMSTTECETEIGDVPIVMQLPDTSPETGEYIPPLFFYDDDRHHGISSPCPYSAMRGTGYLSLQEIYNGEKDTDDKTCPEEDPLPQVIIQKQFPGENDMMGGALDPCDEVAGLPTYTEEAVMCECKDDVATSLAHMPFKVIGRYDLAALRPPFNDIRYLRFLPHNFLTTYLGVSRALQEVKDEVENWNEALLDAIVKRGGTSSKRVVYPEDIIPLLNFGQFDDGDDDDPWDKEYWQELRKQGQIWEEIEVP